MGITNPLFPDEVTNLCNTAAEPNDKPGADGLADIDRFARFMRATKAPRATHSKLQLAQAKKGGNTFREKIGCAICHVPSLTTAGSGHRQSMAANSLFPTRWATRRSIPIVTSCCTT